MKLSASSSFGMFWEEGSVFLRSRSFRLILVFFILSVASQAPFLPEQDLIIAGECCKQIDKTRRTLIS